MAELFLIPETSLRTSENGFDNIGSGSFGTVRRVYHQKLGTAAIKIFRITGTHEHQQSVLEELS